VIALTIWTAVLIVLLVTELRSDPPEARLVPRCLRCDGMRDTGHRCRDAEGGTE